MTYEHLRVLQEGTVARLTLDRPQRLNALNSQLIRELSDFFTSLSGRHEIQAVVMRGAGRAFCAGLDLKAAADAPAELQAPARAFAWQRQLSEVVGAMRRCPQPIVALVNGVASGGGFALALACDVRIATPEARMNAALLQIGLSACDLGLSYFLPRMIGISAAAELLLSGRFIEAQEALSSRLVSRIVPAEQLDAEASRWVADLSRASALGLRLTKETLNLSVDAPGLEAVLALEDRNQVLCAQGPDFAAAIAAFLQRRVPGGVS